ncbi:TetR/AcrR family transcriptional regulator [Paenibacillus illinoisensis]|uniref:TetR/AcrR family transcriptional regulator n=1 Tax=Paenibacillus illinoisensis TaxID=59845 RepID=UPI001C8D2D52|nr:TetR/AcrR family transcriptional regulator [Paenibacillus illinoisensis]MBY0215328.1 TetR/AcrR family transcriptional regulator [Paenibacillus illinoisensis]
MGNKIRNSFVKQQITNALLQLLEKRELTEIAIHEITTTAEVSRNSFYRNYTDKEDILHQYLKSMLSNWKEEWDSKNSDSNAELFGDLFAELKSRAPLFLLLEKRNLFYLFRESYLELNAPPKDTDNMVAYTMSFVAGGVLGWIEEWIARGMQESAEVMSSLLSTHGMK